MITTKEFIKWQQQHGPNFITPKLEKFKIRDDFVIELTSGWDWINYYGASPRRIYGVSVLLKRNRGFTSIGMFKSFSNKKDAIKYFNKLLKIPFSTLIDIAIKNRIVKGSKYEIYKKRR